ncbi:hypothetical protein [Maridesulfovibrio sp.]|uniref:hypothetical protein n=1 Tax=unclassified Maridesulfovibrio TaxID=2794999 RepID=UPI003AFF6743
MGEYFYFLKDGWVPEAEGLIDAGEVVELDMDDVNIKITPETMSSGKVKFFNEETVSFNSPQQLVDVLIEKLLKADFANEKVAELIDEVLD